MTGGGEGVGVEGDEGIFGVLGFEGGVEGEEAGEVICVRYEGCPYWGKLLACGAGGCWARDVPLFESTTLVGSGFVCSAMVCLAIWSRRG